MIHSLNSLDHEGLLPYVDLIRSRKSRECDWFIAEGRWVVERLKASRHEVISIVVGDQVAESFVDSIPPEVCTYRLPRDLVSQLVGFEFHAGIIACGKRRPQRELSIIESSLVQSPSTVVVCPDTTLHDNLGSIIRSCSAFGANALIVGPASADPFSRRSVRVSMGNVFELPIIEPTTATDLESMLDEIVDRFGFHLLAATGGTDAKTLPMPRPADRIAIVLGNEATGIPPALLKKCHHQVSVPMSGATDSLNVTHAASVLLYQFTRVSPRGPEAGENAE